MSYLEEFAEKAIEYCTNLGCQYVDARAETIAKRGIVIENGEMEHSSSKEDCGIGIRVLKKGVWSFISLSSPATVEDVKDAVHKAVKSAQYYSERKKKKIRILDLRPNIDDVVFPVLKKPDLDSLIKIGLDCDSAIHEEKRIVKSSVALSYSTTTKYFVNSEGSKIKQEHTDVIADIMATAHESGLTQSISITEGGRGGLEKIVDDCNVIESAKFASKNAANLIDAHPVKETKTQVVLNPDFVGLLTHEILGHPSEGDRVLGKEMAWAGGAWWAGKLGQKIGSENLNVFDDPTIEGSLGCYIYDDEGVKTTRTNLIENGVLKNHLQSRETAEIFKSKPTGNMRAASYKFMPLIRMACTCIAAGDWDPNEMIRDVKDGYLISNMKVPSIDMKRYNWSISCQFAHRIEHGEIKEMARDVIVMGVAPEFFKSIDACGNDFTVRPITNCGKGDPMQSMIMGNGGPSIKGVAIVKSVEH